MLLLDLLLFDLGLLFAALRLKRLLLDYLRGLDHHLILIYAKLSWLILYSGRADAQFLVIDWEVVFLAWIAYCTLWNRGDVFGCICGRSFQDSLRVGVVLICVDNRWYTVDIFDWYRDNLCWSSLTRQLLKILLRSNAIELFRWLLASWLWCNLLLRIVGGDYIDFVVVVSHCAKRSLLSCSGFGIGEIIRDELVVSTYRSDMPIATSALPITDRKLVSALDFLQVELMLLLRGELVHRHILLGLEVGLLHCLAVGKIRCLSEAVRSIRHWLRLLDGWLLPLVAHLPYSERSVIITIRLRQLIRVSFVFIWKRWNVSKWLVHVDACLILDDFRSFIAVYSLLELTCLDTCRIRPHRRLIDVLCRSS